MIARVVARACPWVQCLAGPLQVRLGCGTLAAMFKDLHHPFFVPLSRRVAVVALCAAWALFEFVAGSPGWGLAAAAVGAYAAYGFFLAWDPSRIRSPDDDQG